MTDVSAEDRTHRAERLKERIYLTFAALAVVLVMSGHNQSDPVVAILTLLVAALGTLLAIFTADIVSHIVVHEALPTRKQFRHMVSASFGALSALIIPFAFLLLALFGVWSTGTALFASAIALLAALVIFGWLAARRIPLTFWQRLLVLGGEALLGLAVIGLQLLAHSS
jgi:hypothetical protein